MHWWVVHRALGTRSKRNELPPKAPQGVPDNAERQRCIHSDAEQGMHSIGEQPTNVGTLHVGRVWACVSTGSYRRKAGLRNQV